VRLFCKVIESFDCAPIQMIVILFAIICSLDKSISTVRETFNIFFYRAKLKSSINPFALSLLTLDYEAEKK
jgi:hypothetical protein